MSERAKAVLAEALRLSDDDRAAVADGLWATLPEDARDDLVDDHGLTADPAFRAELQRRLDLVRDHPEQLIDGDEAFRQIRAKLATQPSERKP